MHRLLPRIAAIGTLLTLAACGGSSGSGSSQSLTLSGTVSGLSASGLVLANGSATAPVTSGAATFSFGAVLSSGATYTVTVQTQPTGQACSIASGSGTTGSASITNVAVTCTTPTYSLGGSVAGLSAAGLVIANGSNTVTVAANGTSFTLPTQLVAGSAYSVTVKTQPTHQMCSVANGTGTVASANIANVVVTCATEAFAVGGSVSGLTTAGLVLANGSDTVAVAANATAFTLPTQVVTGSSYHVTVQTQPTGEACAVTAGQATMPASAVTSVAVRCTDQPFTLGGTISGLTTAGLVITNSADTVSPAANATTFTMPIAVDFNANYTLAVATQPIGLTCSFGSGNSVTASSGTMPASNVTNTALACSSQSFVLGGSVTGLTAGSVVLTDGTDTITVSASGSLNFTMPTAIAYGSQYALTVQTQPTGLTCTPGGNSSGAMPAATVSVTVTCSVNTYTLGGSISGLTSTGLVLANGGGNTVSPASGATTFTLPNGVAFGSTYAVTASTQPTGQTCAVTGGASGTMPANNVGSVQVSCSNNTFTSAGAYTWTVPAGVTSIQVAAIGAGGGGTGICCSDDNNVGGNGALVTSTLSVQPGDVLAIYVGGGGHATDEGGGGGGLTYVGDGATTFLIAGGGGGAGGGPGIDANGGNAGSPGAAHGTAGGGGAGSNGVGGSAGTGGTQTQIETPGSAFTDIVTTDSGSGGIGGGCCIGSGGGSGISGTIGNGGSGGFGFGAGGGGGGYGGGGGGADGADGGNSEGSAGGGGGGSTGPGGTSFAVAPNGGPGAGGATPGTSGTDGSVVITIL